MADYDILITGGTIVDGTRTPAVRAYQRLGYVLGTKVVEARLRRGDMTGLTAGIRRLLARRAGRGGEPGEELAPGHVPDEQEPR